MKYKNSLKKYFVKRSRRIVYFLKLNPKNYKPETFHKLRTEIKKIHAVFDVLNDCVKSFKRENTFKPFEVVFKGAGGVRDVQVKAALFEKYKISLKKDSLSGILQKELKHAKEKFRKQITNKITNEIKKNLALATNTIGELKHKDADRYFKTEEGKIKKLLKEEAKPEKLHEIRRQLKTFYYNLKAAEWSGNNVPFRKMDSVQELLGKWHDGRVAERYIDERKDVKGINRLEKKRFEIIRIRLKKHNNILVKKIAGQNRELALKIKLFCK